MTSNDTGDRGTGRPAHWLIVERYENWVVDRARGFATLGFPERMKKRASQLRAGDLLFVYVSSGVSCLADIREVTNAEINYKPDFEYEDLFQYQIQTKPLVTLEEDAWIRIHSVADRLEFLSGHKDWRQCMRVPLRALSDGDAHVIGHAIPRAAKSTDSP